MSSEIKFVLAGFLVGGLVGFSGMGGGSVMTPLLIALGLPPTKAVGSDLAYSALTKTLGSFSHARKQNVDWGLALWLAAGSVPASIAGVATLGLLKVQLGGGANGLIEHLLGGMLIAVGLSIVARVLTYSGSTRVRTAEALELARRQKVGTVLIGVIGGFGVGLTSVGSGTLFALALITSYPLVARRVVGTDIFHATLLVWAAGLAHVVAGNVQFSTVASLLVGSLPGVLLGSRATGWLPERPVRAALGGVLVLSGALLV